MNVSNEQLLEDIENTIQEMDAYDFLRKGFNILSKLPENQESSYNQPAIKYLEYERLYEECGKFLRKLYVLKEERGIEMEEEI